MISAFIIASTLICITPGPSMLLVIKHTLEGGLRKGLASICGVLLADAALLTLSISGLGALLHSSPVLYTALKIMGAAYLIYLGGASLLSNGKSSEVKENSPFLGAIGVTLLNPKIIGFFIAFFPQFINQEEALSRQWAILGSLFLLIVFVVLLAYALFAERMGERLKTGKRAWQIAAGVSLIACGIIAL